MSFLTGKANDTNNDRYSYYYGFSHLYDAIGNAINKMKDESKEFSCLIVSHYARMYELVKPTHVHVIVNGRVVTSGDYTIVEKIDKQGYDWIKSELGVEIQKEVAMNTVSIGACATKALKK